MATQYGAIVGVTFLREAPSSGIGGTALVSFTMPAYTASSDNGQLGGGGSVDGVANTATLATILQNKRRDGKTVTLRGAMRAESGLQGTTNFFAGTFAVSAGNITFNVENQTGTEIDAASGVSDRPIQVEVSYELS